MSLQLLGLLLGPIISLLRSMTLLVNTLTKLKDSTNNLQHVGLHMDILSQHKMKVIKL